MRPGGTLFPAIRPFSLYSWSVIALLLLTPLSCFASQAPPDAAQAGVFQVSVQGVERKQMLANEFGELFPGPGNMFVVVRVTITNRDVEPRNLRGAAFLAEDNKGRRFEPTRFSTQHLMQTQAFPNVPLNAQLVFDVPKDAAGLALKLSMGDAVAGKKSALLSLQSGSAPASTQTTKKSPAPSTTTGKQAKVAAPTPPVAAKAGDFHISATNFHRKQALQSAMYDWVQSPVGEFAAMTVEITNNSDKPARLDQVMFQLKDARGRDYAPHMLSDSKLFLNNIYPGQSLSGRLVFELPIAAGKVTLSFTPAGKSAQLAL